MLRRIWCALRGHPYRRVLFDWSGEYPKCKCSHCDAEIPTGART